MESLKSIQNQVEFSANSTDEFGRALTYKLSVFINSNGSEAQLWVDAKSYTLTGLKKATNVEFNGLKEELHLLQGTRKDLSDTLVTIITNCGVNPPEFRIIFENIDLETTEDKVYYIDHGIQTDVNNLIDQSRIQLVPLPDKYYNRVAH